MANLLWGNVYYKNHFAGVLREEPGNRSSFTYDDSYLGSDQPAIAYSLPLQRETFISQVGLPSFFDNLVAEGWLETAQTRLLGRRMASRFELLLAFGEDCAGAVSVIDPEPRKLSQQLLNMEDPVEVALLASRSSLSGIQPKLALIESDGKLYPTTSGKISTHIGKLPSQHHDNLVANEYLTTLAFKALLPDDEVVEMDIGKVEGISKPALIIKRFDRTANVGRLHFEEFTQLLDLPSHAKYDGAHKDMANFILKTKGCIPIEIYRLFQRILAGFLLGNTDMHLKNFAMFHHDSGFRLTPAYDEISSAIYQYKTVALAIGGSKDLLLGQLKPKNIIKLAEEFYLQKTATLMAVEKLQRNLEDAKHAILKAPIGSPLLKKKLVTMMEKRWNGTFALIGQDLSKKP
ncbi:MAG: HipA domain-containing protein [Pseudomonadota bacterium]